ncbi:MAG: hypothetical protein JWP61_1038 [Friedmanniella sp.]|nr:hypothetical protein [Friedmanniella sp.]
MPNPPPPADPPDQAHPGERLGLPADGPGSLASWRSRVTALVLDWGACMAAAVAFFGSGVLTGSGWRSWMILSLFFVQSTVLCALAGGSLGQLICRITVYRLDGQRMGLPRSVLRAALVSLALPALVVGVDRRGLQDLAAGTVVVARR